VAVREVVREAEPAVVQAEAPAEARAVEQAGAYQATEQATELAMELGPDAARVAGPGRSTLRVARRQLRLIIDRLLALGVHGRLWTKPRALPGAGGRSFEI
jgi:hypothetical protein